MEQKEDNTNDSVFTESMKSRKLLFSVAVFTVSTALLVFGYVGDSVWADVSVGVVIAYLTGNVANKAIVNRHGGGGK